MKLASPCMALTLFAVAAPVPAAPGQAAPSDRWIHIRVENTEAKGEMVRVNVPLTLAEKVLPTINNDRIHNGKLKVNQANVNGVDLHALLDAVRSARDGEFVTAQGTTGDVRVAKNAGYLQVHVRELKEGTPKRVEVRLPLTVVDALVSAGSNELDLVAGLRALATQGDTELVTVKDGRSTVRIWLDSKNTAD
ncbi:MAG TPA: hypothetical protein VKE24_06350 [Candidatus Acidoferrales bacterium]|nr:hypothetical protein [Candidatus Acidoferrales bacterium]